MTVFCADLGGTKSRAALFSPEGALLATAFAGPGAASLGAPRAIAIIEELWRAVTGAHPVERAATVAALGIAGIGLAEAVTGIRTALAGFARTICVNDGYGTLIDATGGAAGTLVMVGTGVAALRLDADGRCHISSGWGFPGGDLGSGAWIGLQAAGALTAALDGIGALSGTLVARLRAEMGETAPGIMDWITTARAADYARLAPIIARSDDPAAIALMGRAAQHIAEVAKALACSSSAVASADTPNEGARRVVHLSGGLAGLMVDHCARAAPGLVWSLVDADPLRGLRLVAIGAAPTERLADRPGLGQPDYGPVTGS